MVIGLDQSDVKTLMILLGRLDEMNEGSCHFTGTIDVNSQDRVIDVHVWYDSISEVHRLRLLND
jgi:hypothetical protein